MIKLGLFQFFVFIQGPPILRSTFESLVDNPLKTNQGKQLEIIMQS